MKCPSCKSLNVRGSDRVLFTDLIRRLRGESAYRCRNCRHRFHGPRDPKDTGAINWQHFSFSSRYRDQARSAGRQVALFAFGLALFFAMLKLVAR